MKNINQEELNKILKEHKLWLKGEGGKRADLENTNLKDVYLKNANLQYANLKDANLEMFNLRGSNLRYANLKNADLQHANLSYTNLKGSYLEGVKTNMSTIGYNLACPEEGSFVGYKKAGKCIVKLLILEDAKRSSATTMKCRCSKAKVLDIENIETGELTDKVHSDFNPKFIYKVGEIVYVDNFDDDRWNECAPGIHFFMNKENAINY